MKSEGLRADWERNRLSVKSLFIVLFFRTSGWFAQHSSRPIRDLGLPIRALYKFIVEFVMGVELPDRVVAGPGLAVYHGVGLVVNAQVTLGKNVTLRQNTTIGSKWEGGPSPTICDNVSVGANCVLIGDIEIGSNCIIGAGAIVTQDCPSGSVIYGPKAEIAPKRTQDIGNHD
ncbi:serine acetyltransferase [Rhodobacter sp. NSM]|uniref:serine acetyltransferase n=1 Tax=Rhodobacter sp. NSM TaxID=3457501 RepID=UPI003FCFF469